MKTRSAVYLTAIALLLAAGLRSTAAEAAPPTFQYEGRLSVRGVPATGDYTLRFSLHSEATGLETQLGDFITNRVNVTAGAFTCPLEAFGAASFNGTARWLGVEVQQLSETGAVTYVTLNPRQPLGVVPYALYAFSGAGAGAQGPQGEKGERD